MTYNEQKLSYYVIYYEKFKNVMQWTEKEALSLQISCKDMKRVECVLKVWFKESIVLF